jgi:sugar phosphate isomerase/epimerase
MQRHEQQITRRIFFSRTGIFASSTLSVAAASRFAPPARGDDPLRTIGLGFSLYGMKALTIRAALQALAEIGYDCIELPVMPDWPGDSSQLSAAARRELRGLLAERALRLTALMENLPAVGDDAQQRTNLERLKRAAELAHDVQREKAAPPLIETILGGKAGEFEAVKERLVERLGEWTSVLADAQVVLTIKAHVGNSTQRPEQLLWLLDKIASPWLKAAYDYSHFQLQNLDLPQTLDKLLPKSAFIHVKDTEHSQGKRGFLLPGEGTIDYVQMFRLLRASPYRGDVVVEVSSQVSNKPGYEPLAAASKCYNHLAEAFAKAGLQRG